jgi:hypothetical protein
VCSGSVSGVLKRSHWNDFLEDWFQEQAAIEQGADALRRFFPKTNRD